jgi:hypothetical protein
MKKTNEVQKLTGFWTIRKYRTDEDFRNDMPYEINQDENLALNTGITELWNIFTGVSGHAVFSNGNSEVGVGDSNTAAVATQADLQAATNKTYVACDATFPSINAQTVTFQSTFTGTAANYAWNEMVVKNSSSTICLNRLVSAQGTKTSGQTWQIQVAITLS